MRRWERLGHRFAPSGDHSWARSHASTPWGSWLDDGLLRVHVTTRDGSNRSHIGWVDLDPERTFTAVRQSVEPVLEPGPPGRFDDSGVAMGCVVQHGERALLYYVGWNLRVTVPWTNTIGLAVRERGEATFVKHGRVPVLDRSEEDPYSLSYPSVVQDPDGLTMWYGTNDGWGADQASMAHAVNRATSIDGIHWSRDAERALRPRGPLEYALSRPMVRRTADGFEMHYSHRATASASTYRIGWATSSDGRRWIRRDDEVGFDVAPAGWDSDMVCYPFVFDHEDATYMLYNGNAYGGTGFGLARLVEE